VSAAHDPSGAPFAWRGKVASAALRAGDSLIRDLISSSTDQALMSVAAGVPALECFPEQAFRRAIDRILRRHGRAVWGHGETEGLPAFRDAIARRFGGRADNVLVLAGAQQGLDLLARCLIEPGDTVVVDRPGYLGAIHTFRAAGARLVGWDVVRHDLDELEDQLVRYKPKLIYTNPTFQNPTGWTMAAKLRRELLAVAARYRVPIIEDDTYRELHLGNPPPPSMHALDLHPIVIHLNSFSKILAPGLRLGWLTASGERALRRRGASRPTVGKTRRSPGIQKTELPERAHGAAPPDGPIRGDECQIVHPCSGRDQTIRGIGRERVAQLLRFDGHVDGERKDFEVRRCGGRAEPQRPPTEALAHHDPAMGEVPGGLFQRDCGYPDALRRGDRTQGRAGATAQPGMVEHGPEPRLRVQHVLHAGLLNQASEGAIGSSMLPRISAVPARQPTRPPARSLLAVMGTIFATSRSRLRMTTVSPPAARRISSLARSRNSPILIRFTKGIVAKIFGHVNGHPCLGSGRLRQGRPPAAPTTRRRHTAIAS